MLRWLALSLLVVTVLGIYFDAKPDCRKNEHEHICGSLCEPICDSNGQDPNPLLCPKIVNVCSKLTKGCRCVDGTVRNKRNKTCIPLDGCP